MMYAVPLYSLRYNIPAMSMSWKTSCIVDRSSRQLITFGAGDGVKVPQHLRCRGCVAADDFFAILTDQDEVWASGGLNVLAYENGAWSSAPLGKEDNMTNVAGKALMLVGHGSRLACVTRAFTVRPLSIVSNPVRSIIPSRHVRFLDLGYSEDYFMVGADAVLYKTTASKRTLGTPRRVMALSRTSVSRVASGTGFYLIIDQSGQLFTIGRNKKGQLGNGQHQNVRRKPYLHKSLRHHFFVMVAAGDSHSLALTSSGLVYGAGSNESGQLGLGTSLTEAVFFTQIPLPSKCVGIAAGPAGSMFACEDGHVYTCGLNDYGQLGLEVPDRTVHIPTTMASVTEGVKAYTMDFGAYYKPVMATREPEFTPAPPHSPPPNAKHEETVEDALPQAQTGPETQQGTLQPASLDFPENDTPPKHPGFEMGQRPKEKRAMCAKCCAVM
ncbi:hypothetical protein DQ04_01641100 [Trypanosoma grayi]|uniref:hypothetical protein n=1 Tax=Trypanosoma grayi TaxID=71804 RepID=UPI0004F46A86|nr:hypothetical protein DQ04_01641100 [Trypanosoma grayi]KEG12531.1 hypothetical protein DQ04_01641100 [Trypanosoma grayi]